MPLPGTSTDQPVADCGSGPFLWSPEGRAPGVLERWAALWSRAPASLSIPQARGRALRGGVTRPRPRWRRTAPASPVRRSPMLPPLLASRRSRLLAADSREGQAGAFPAVCSITDSLDKHSLRAPRVRPPARPPDAGLGQGAGSSVQTLVGESVGDGLINCGPSGQ